MSKIDCTLNAIDVIFNTINDKCKSVSPIIFSGDIIPYVYNEVAPMPKYVEVLTYNENDDIKCHRALAGLSKDLYKQKLIKQCIHTVDNNIRYELTNDRTLIVRFTVTTNKNIRYDKFQYKSFKCFYTMETLSSYINRLMPTCYDDLVNVIMSKDKVSEEMWKYFSTDFNMLEVEEITSPLVLTETNYVIDNPILYKACVNYFLVKICNEDI